MQKTYKKKNNGFNFGAKKEFKNITQERKFKKIKNWYGTISVGEKSYLVQCESMTRSYAEKVFKQDAKELNGQLDKFIGVLN